MEEILTAGMVIKVQVKEHIYNKQSPFQLVNVYDLEVLGRTLVLDNVLQSAEVDEWVYHESLVHPALIAHANPKTVFIGGGGEGATAREVLRFKTVERCVMVDIDEAVIEVSKKVLTCHHAGAYDDPRMHTVVDDAEKWLKETDEKFDVLVMDLADPLEAGPCWKLYTKEFYQFLISRLNPGGILVSQCGPGGLLFQKDVFSPVQNTLKTVFKNSRSYTSHVPSFQDVYGFTMVSNEADLFLSPEEIDKRIKERITGENKYYDGATHVEMFALPKYTRKLFESETRVGTLDDPASFFKGGGNSK
jgi:spermidine synthase